MVYNNKHLQSVENFRYIGVNFSRNNSFTKGLKERSQQIYQSQSVLYLHTLRHPSASASHIFELFDCLLKPKLLYGFHVKYGVWKLQIFGTISHKLYNENIRCKEHYKCKIRDTRYFISGTRPITVYICLVI